MAPSDIEHTAMNSNSATSQDDATIETVATHSNSQAGVERTATDGAMDGSVGSPTSNDKGDYYSQLLSYINATTYEEPYFGEFGTLQRLNIVHIQMQLAELHSEVNKRPPTDDELRNLRGLMRDYTQAIRDMEYMSGLESHMRIQIHERTARTTHFPSMATASFSTLYLALPKQVSKPVDFMLFLRKLIHKCLPDVLASPGLGGLDLSNRFVPRTPKEDSSFVKWLARLIIALAAGAWLIVPIVIMTVPDGSKTKDLVTMSVAIVLFGMTVAWVVGSEPKPQDIVTATAAYAAVLVVFYGNVVSGKSDNKA